MIKVVRGIPYTVNQKAFWGLLGYKKGKSQISPEMMEKIEKTIEKAKKVIKPVGIYGLFGVEELREGYLIIGGEKINSRSLASHFMGFTHGYLMAVTIGEEFDRLMETLPVDQAVILDAFGSEAVEGVAESLNRAIEREGVHFGLHRFHRRYSPGYGDLSLKTNLVFDKLLGLSSVGIRVTERFSLLPLKSITAIIPAGG